MSKVSIIVPVYNKQDVIERCLDSILAQDHKDIEVIVVDDGSKDGSWDIISRYGQKDERIVGIHKTNGGVSAARNAGLDKANGDYIQFVDADDWLPPDSTRQLLRAMEDSHADLVVGDFYRVIDDKVSKKGSIRKAGLLSVKEYADRMLLTPADFYFGVIWNKLYRRDIIEKEAIRMDPDVSYSEDAIFNLQYLKHAARICIVKAPVYYYVKSEGSLVAKNFNIENIIRMKTTVIGYYEDFFRQILSRIEYEERRPLIYSFLLAFATDSLALPLVEDTKKLGEEASARVVYDDSLDASGLDVIYLLDALLERLLYPVSEQIGYDIEETRVLYLLYRIARPCSSEEVASLCGISSVKAAMILTRLAAGQHVKIADISLFGDKKVLYEYVSGDIDRLLSDITSDQRQICFEGLDDEEIRTYTILQEKITGNLKRRLVSGQENIDKR